MWPIRSGSRLASLPFLESGALVLCSEELVARLCVFVCADSPGAAMLPRGSGLSGSSPSLRPAVCGSPPCTLLLMLSSIFLSGLILLNTGCLVYEILPFVGLASETFFEFSPSVLGLISMGSNLVEFCI